MEINSSGIAPLILDQLIQPIEKDIDSDSNGIDVPLRKNNHDKHKKLNHSKGPFASQLFPPRDFIADQMRLTTAHIASHHQKAISASIEKMVTYQKMRKKVSSSLNQLSKKIKESSLNFDTFVPSEKLSSKAPHDKSFAHSSGKIVTEILSHEISHRIGKRTGVFLDISSKTYFSPTFEHSTSQRRDAVVSASIEFGITEVVFRCAKLQWPTWLIMLGIEAGARTASVSGVASRKLENLHFPYLDSGLSIHESSLALPMTAQALQAPEALLHLIKEKLTTKLATNLDTLGLTDANISLVISHAINLIAKYSPDLMEERVWTAAHEAHVLQQSKLAEKTES